jgi:hypothetical protein
MPSSPIQSEGAQLEIELLHLFRGQRWVRLPADEACMSPGLSRS